MNTILMFITIAAGMCFGVSVVTIAILSRGYRHLTVLEQEITDRSIGRFIILGVISVCWIMARILT